MICRTCRSPNQPGGRFCTACGSQLALTCSACGFANTPSDRFCGGCGKAAAAVAHAEPTAQQAVVQRRAGDGERKRVTVLFADLKGSTAAIEGLDPEAALGQIEPAVQIMMRLVHRYEGVVCRRLGDGILALFGAPVAHEDHAVRACFAGLGIQRELREAGMADRARVGLNSGEVLYRTIASDLGIEVDVGGPVVHVAARMEQMAPAGGVYLTGETQALTQGLIETRAVGPLEVKGASAPIETYEAVGASLYVSRWEASRLRERAPFVGREGERSALETALAALERRHGSVIGISGEAGLGKSRLVHGMIREGGPDGGHKALFAAATGLGRTIPYHALASALRDLFGISERDDAIRVRERVGTVLGETDVSLLADAAVFASMVSLSAAMPEWLAMDPHQKRLAAREATLRLCRHVAAVRPLVLVFEDMHWIDRDSEEVLRAVAQLAREAALLVVLTYRSEYDDSWLAPAGGTRLRMAPLGDEEVRRSLDEWFVAGPETEQLIARLTARAGGNPLFVEECVRDLAQSGALTTVVAVEGAGARRRYACSQTPEAIRMPPSVHDVIASRIDRRSPDCVGLLQTLSMIDGRIPLWLAAAVGGQAPAAAEAVLREAVAAEILVQASLYPDVEYVFAHALLREVAHDSLTRVRRVEAHRRIVEAVETPHAERPEDQAELLAHHAARGELWDKAARYQGQAAERALARGSYAEAIAGMRAALKSFDAATPSLEGTRRAIDQLRALRALLYATGGDPVETHRVLARAEALALGADDRLRLAWVMADQSAQFWVEGDNGAAATAAQGALEIAEQAGETSLRALALFRLGLAIYAIGDYVRAAVALRQSCELLVGDLRAERIGTAGATYVLGGGYLVTTLCELGKFDEAEAWTRDLTAAAAMAGDVYSIASAQMGSCVLAIARADVAAAIPPLETLLGAAKQAGALAVSQFIENLLGHARLVNGDAAGSLLLLAPKKEYTLVPRTHAHGLAKVWLAEALGANRRIKEALAVLDDVERGALARGERGTLAHCWKAKGELARAAGDLVEAEIQYRRSLAQARQLSMAPVCEACEAALAALAALQPGPSVERNVEV
ncbi:adenylate/guanylate cyclase domain-containing protein [soil metagenome]